MDSLARFASALSEPGKILVLLALDCPSPICPTTGSADIELLSLAFGPAADLSPSSPRVTRMSKES
ncbi:MAG: hypothetical protein U1E34_04345 [Amaricoccus sp.]